MNPLSLPPWPVYKSNAQRAEELRRLNRPASAIITNERVDATRSDSLATVEGRAHEFANAIGGIMRDKKVNYPAAVTIAQRTRPEIFSRMQHPKIDTRGIQS